MSAAVERKPRLSTGRLRALLAAGGLLMLTVGVTSAAFNDHSRAVLTGPARSTTAGIGYAELPAIWLSDEGSGGFIVAPPAGRDYWMSGNGVPISTDPGNTLELSVAIVPRVGATYAIDVTPTLHTGIDPDSGERDPFPWLRFTVTLPGGRILENLSAAEFNALPDRTFTACRDGGCDHLFKVSVTLDPLASYTVHDAKAHVRVTFDGMTIWRS